MSEIDNVGRFPIVGEPGTELITFPPGTQIFPNTDEMLWQIAKEVAEGNPLHKYAGQYYCNYCDERQSGMELERLIGELSIEENPDKAKEQFIRQFPHDQDCIVTKARELMEWRKQQPQMKVKVRIDGGGYCNAPLPKGGE